MIDFVHSNIHDEVDEECEQNHSEYLFGLNNIINELEQMIIINKRL